MLVDDKAVVMSIEDFLALPWYQGTDPTGPRVGFRWKRCVSRQHGGTWRDPSPDDGKWMMYEVEPDPEPGYVIIRSRELLVV